MGKYRPTKMPITSQLDDCKKYSLFSFQQQGKSEAMKQTTSAVIELDDDVEEVDERQREAGIMEFTKWQDRFCAWQTVSKIDCQQINNILRKPNLESVNHQL